MLADVDTSGENLGFGTLVLRYKLYFDFSKFFKNSSNSGGKNSPILLIMTVAIKIETQEAKKRKTPQPR